MLSAVKNKLDYHDMMSMLVCDVNSKRYMINRCLSCPGIKPLLRYLKETIEPDFDLDDDITFKQWLTTDRTTLVTQQCNAEDFLQAVVEEIDNLTSHHYISKHQSQHLRRCKDELQLGLCIVILDFAENYSFVAQDVAQGFHWENTPATLHPFSVYYRAADGCIQTLSLCVISDHMKHDTVAVHAFQTVILEHLKQSIVDLKYVIYFRRIEEQGARGTRHPRREDR